MRRLCWTELSQVTFFKPSAYRILNYLFIGDLGFDPLGIAKTQKELFAIRESEIKHGRIALLAALGWPLSELYHYTIAEIFGMENLLADGQKAPSVLNGGLDNTYVLSALGLFFAVGGVLELEMMRIKKEVPEPLRNFYDMWNEEGWDEPGNYGFDPLKLGKVFCKTTKDRVFMQSIEIFNARVAMLAVVGYAVQECVTGDVNRMLRYRIDELMVCCRVANRAGDAAVL